MQSLDEILDNVDKLKEQTNPFFIEPLFIVPIYVSSIKRNFTEQELDFIKNQKMSKNTGNERSVDSYLLDKEELKDLKEFVQEALDNYFKNIIVPQNEDVKPYITQSWSNITKKDGFHHKHSHSNSFLSGVLYIQTDPSDRIYFDREVYPVFQIPTKQNSPFNANGCWYWTPVGHVFIFPSNIPHSVDVKQTDGDRISISFNTFIKGTLGGENVLTELKL
jgi:uncharacterized protein (TIGR02466 family)